MPSFPKEVAIADVDDPAARQSVVSFLRNVNRKSTAVTQDDLYENGSAMRHACEGVKCVGAAAA